NILLFNGREQEKGMWPRQGQQGIYNIIDSVQNNTQFTANSLSGMPNLNGAEVVIRKSYYTIDRLNITGHSGNSLTFSGHSPYDLKHGYGFFIQNHKLALTELGDWCYNASTKTLSVYFGPNGPSGHTVRIATEQDLIRKGWSDA